MTCVIAIEWNLKTSGRVIPKLHVDPIYLNPDRQIPIATVHAYSFKWVLEKCVGVNAIIFLEMLRNGSAYVGNVSFPMIPDSPQFCHCGKQFKLIGRHLTCINESCTFKGTGKWILTTPLTFLTTRL